MILPRKAMKSSNDGIHHDPQASSAGWSPAREDAQGCLLHLSYKTLYFSLLIFMKFCQLKSQVPQEMKALPFNMPTACLREFSLINNNVMLLIF